MSSSLLSGDLIFSYHVLAASRRAASAMASMHATYGAVYGKDHDPVLERPVRTSPDADAADDAPGSGRSLCGLHRLERDQFGPEYTNNLFCCQFNLRKVSRHVLVPKGSTYETQDSDFLVSDNLDFHPTDVIEDADGSLLVVDTGGWYKLCCPTSQLVKPDVTGAIYRVKKIGSHREKVQPQPQPLPRLRQIALERDRAGLKDALAGLKDPNPHTRRRAAEALGRIGQPRAVPAILAALADATNDRTLDTALTFALIEINDIPGLRDGLNDRSPRVRRACLAALSNIPKSGLVPSDVLAELDSADAALRETAWWVAGRNPQWGDRLAGYFAERLKVADRLKPDEQAELVDRLVKFAATPAVQDVLTATIRSGSRAGKLVAVRTLARAGLKTPSPEWGRALSVLPLADAELLRDYLLALRSHPPSADDYNLMQVAVARHEAESGRLPDEVRLAILAVAPPRFAIADADFRTALGKLDREQPPAVRAAAAEVMLRRPLTDAQLVALAAALKAANPLDLPKLLTPFEKSRDETVGRALVRGLREPAVRRAVREELVKPILDRYPAAVKAEAETLYAELAEARKGEREKLDALLANLKPGDVRRGQLVFNSPKTQCIACHKMGYVGGTVGPDLTRIGGIRSERDLLEAIVFPSASFVRSYEPVRVVTTDDRTVNGILKKDAPDEVVVVVAADKEERIPRAEVAEIGPSSVSLMPSGLEQQLTPQDLADLVAFLKASK
jgi:putative heme-binding domain-containing protein